MQEQPTSKSSNFVLFIVLTFGVLMLHSWYLNQRRPPPEQNKAVAGAKDAPGGKKQQPAAKPKADKPEAEKPEVEGPEVEGPEEQAPGDEPAEEPAAGAELVHEVNSGEAKPADLEEIFDAKIEEGAADDQESEEEPTGEPSSDEKTREQAAAEIEALAPGKKRKGRKRGRAAK